MKKNMRNYNIGKFEPATPGLVAFRGKKQQSLYFKMAKIFVL